MATSNAIMQRIAAIISAQLNATVVRAGQTVVGWPFAPEGAAIWGAGKYLVTVWPLKARRETRFSTAPFLLQTPPPVGLLVMLTGAGSRTLTFSGANSAGLNIHTAFGAPLQRIDTLYQTTGTETLAQLATAVAALINAWGTVTATATGPSVSITGSFPLTCNVAAPISANPSSGYPILVQEVGRFTRTVQVTSWTTEPDGGDGSRDSVDAQVLYALGGADKLYQTAPDGSSFRAEWLSPDEWTDAAESSYGVFGSHNLLEVNYPLLKPIGAAPVGAIEVVSTMDGLPPLTQIIGGNA